MSSEEYNESVLKRFLFSLPSESQFQFSDTSRLQIRRAIFQSLSNNGKYLSWFFPECELGNSSPINSQDQLVAQIEKNYQWSLSTYYKILSRSGHNGYDIHNSHANHANSPCAKIFRKGEPIIRCLTCAYDDTCAMCYHCYRPEHHEGHNIHITICPRESGGVCDCGDPEAWVKPFICDYGKQDETAIELQSKNIPKDFELSFIRTIETLLDYVIDVMSHSNLQFSDSEATDISEIRANTHSSMLDSAKYGFSEKSVSDDNNGRYFLILYNDQVRHYRDAVQRIHLTSKKVLQFATMIADEVQSYGRAKVISSGNLELLRERQKVLSGTGMATCIRSHRDAFREDMCHEILTWISDLTETKIFKVNNHIKDIFSMAFCCKWNPGLVPQIVKDYSYKVGTLDSHLKIPKIASRKSKRSQAHWFFKPGKWNLPKGICEICGYNISEEEFDHSKNIAGSRFQYLVYLDIGFWKSIRALLHDMYSTSLITNLHYKNILSCQYVDIYPSIADMFLTLDREPELNIMCILSTQLFTCPSSSTYIIEHGDISRVFAAIYGFLTVEEIKAPEDVDISQELSLKSLRNRRWSQIFFDISYILSRSQNPKAIFTSNIIPMACDIMNLFQGRPVIKRESKSHVEYESPEYTAFFHAIVVIYQFGECIAHCLYNFKNSEKAEMTFLAANSIKNVIQFLLMLENNDYPGSVEDGVDINTGNDKQISKELIGGYIIQHFRIDSEKVSFLHPVHSFLSWLIEISNLSSVGMLTEVLESSVTSSSLSGFQSLDIPNPLAAIFDYPIRTLVLMSQIKTGFWVRNGFSVKSQLQLYRGSTLRDGGFMRDLFLCQVFVNSSSPNLVCFLLFSRWLFMDGWLLSKENLDPLYDNDDEDKNPNGLVYDSKTMPYMLDECVNFFIILLTENLYLQGLKVEDVSKLRVQCEIVHNLCFGPMSYTQLCSQIPDHTVADKRFDIILEEMTAFKPPTGSKDIGYYELKDEYLDEVNPYYLNYSANTKDDAIKFVKNRLSRKLGKSKSEIVIEPKLPRAEDIETYKHIGNFSASSYFSNFIIKTLQYIIEVGPKELDSLMESVLHLIHICAYETYIDVEKYGTFYDRFVSISDSFNTSIAILLYKISMDQQLSEYHAKIHVIFRLFESRYHSLEKILSEQIEDFDMVKLRLDTPCPANANEYDQKKKLAKDRQAKLIAKFKKQQSSFLKDNFHEKGEHSDDEMDDYTEEGWKFPETHCLLCQNAAKDAGPFGIISYVSKSSEFRVTPFSNAYWLLKAFSDQPSLDTDQNEKNDMFYSDNWKSYMKMIKDDHVIGPGFSNNEYVNSKYVSSSCGHGMHFQCYLNFINGNQSRQNQITRNTPENIDHKEFLCPLCKSINNMFIPVLWNRNTRSLSSFLSPSSPEPLKYFELLNSTDVFHKDWFQMFANEVYKDLESSMSLSASALEIMGATKNESENKIESLSSNIYDVLTLLTFPKVFTPESSTLLINNIKSAEISLRGVSSHGFPVICQLSNNTLINLRILHESRNTSIWVKSKKSSEGSIAASDVPIKLLSNLLLLSRKTFSEAVLEQDFFEILAETLPMKSHGFSFNTILSMCYLASVIQSGYIIAKQLQVHEIFQNTYCSIYDVPVISNISEEESHKAWTFFHSLTSSLSHGHDNLSSYSDESLGAVFYSMLIKATTPFLRRAAILAFVACADIDSMNLSEYNRMSLEADNLCSLLNLDTLSSLLSKINGNPENSFHAKRFNLFLDYIKLSSPDLDFEQQLEYPGLIRLIDLPERLDHFFSKYYYSDKFDNPGKSIEDPAVCLFCGDVMDIQKKAVGCKEGQCTTHYLKECPNSVGIFLLPKQRNLLLLHKSGGSFHASPYLDKHGEVAVPMESKRNKTLFLMLPRYDDFIRNMWLQHNIQNFVVRKLDSVMDAGGWETL